LSYLLPTTAGARYKIIHLVYVLRHNAIVIHYGEVHSLEIDETDI